VAVARLDGDGSVRVAAVAARHERTLLRVARQASLCHDDALDAYQRALEIFVRRVDTVDPATELAWLKVVVRHEAMAIRRSRCESVAVEALDLDGFVADSDRSVEERIASDERVRRSAEALRSLKPDEANALMLKAHGLSYDEIGTRNRWSYTKTNRAITEGRRRFLAAYQAIESGEECARFAPIVEALGAGSASAAQVLRIRPHLRHCTACRATVRELHLSRLRRASLFWPVFVLAEPLGRLAAVKHDAAALLHRAQASDLATGGALAGSGGGGRIATVGTVVGLCLGGASVGTVCVVTGTVPDLRPGDAARPAAARAEPTSRAARRTPGEAKRVVVPVATVAARATVRDPAPAATRPDPAPAKAASSRPREREREREKREAAPREFGFEQQAESAPPAATTAQSVAGAPPQPPPTAEPAPSDPPARNFSPAEQEFAP
jgi:RNA polymerase sigma factor (sigma-70 family)